MITPTYNSQAVSISNDSVKYHNDTYDTDIDSSTDVIKQSTHTFQNVESTTHAAFYTDQDGYDLVGNNIKVAPRTVTLDASKLPDGSLTKTYDGTTAVNQDKLASFLTSAGTASGLIPTKYDTSYTITYDGLAGEYADKNVGTGKTIKLSGGMTVKNNSYSNYNFVDASGNVTNTVTYGDNSTIKGSITAKTLKIALKSSNPTREYDGKDDTARGRI